jgi:hypothetical protein
MSTTRGHHLLAAWMVEQYGERNRRRPALPSFPAMCRFMADLNERTTAEPLSSAFAIYDWLAGSANPRAPGKARREVIADLTGGAVPASAWDVADDEPAQAAV